MDSFEAQVIQVMFNEMAQLRAQMWAMQFEVIGGLGAVVAFFGGRLIIRNGRNNKEKGK